MGQRTLFDEGIQALILDCNALCYRSFYTLKDLNFKEIPTSVLFGFLRQTLALAKRFECGRIVFCWDSKKSYRKRIFPEYKIKRATEKSPREKEAMRLGFSQFSTLRSTLLPALGFQNVFVRPGYEADDLIALIVQGNPDIGFLVVSADSDLYQLLGRNLRIYNWKKVLTEEWFIKKYGIDPPQWAEAKAIGGCDTDSVPGIRGIADPSKSKVDIPPVIQYLSGVLNKGKLLDRIQTPESQAIIRRNRRLVRLPLRVSETEEPEPIPVDLSADRLVRETFIKVFDRYGFQSFLSQKAFGEWQDLFSLEK